MYPENNNPLEDMNPAPQEQTPPAEEIQLEYEDFVDVPGYAAPETTYPQPEEPAPEVAPPVPKKQRKWLGAAALCLSCALLGGVIGAVVYSAIAPQEKLYSYQVGNTTIQQGVREPVVISPVDVDTNRIMTPAEVYATYVNSTVGITASITTNYWGYQSTAPASGSGFILSEDGYVVTNYHVVDGSSSISVSLYDGKEYPATLIGYDESNDVAVLKINATGLAPVVLGKSSQMHVGDNVVAIGNPLGELTFSLTAGTVSALNRDVTMETGVTMTLIQTDCAINSGNSGGALFNMYGEVIGITNAKYSSNSYGSASIDNIGFAIPIDDVQSIIESIIEKGYIAKPYIGVSVSDVSEESLSYGLPKGAAVRDVVKDSPAEASGLQVSDIITHINGEAIEGSTDLVAFIRASKVDDVLTVTVYRRGQTVELTLVVGEQVNSAMPN